MLLVLSGFQQDYETAKVFPGKGVNPSLACSEMVVANDLPVADDGRQVSVRASDGVCVLIGISQHCNGLSS
jgi:hypothetical protein